MAERIQRLMMALILALGLVLHGQGYSWGLYLNWFVVAMVTFWGVTGLCPSLLIMRRLGVPSEGGSR